MTVTVNETDVALLGTAAASTPVRVTVVTPLLKDNGTLPDPSGMVLPEEVRTVAPVVE